MHEVGNDKNNIETEQIEEQKYMVQGIFQIMTYGKKADKKRLRNLSINFKEVLGDIRTENVTESNNVINKTSLFYAKSLCLRSSGRRKKIEKNHGGKGGSDNPVMRLENN